MTNQLRRDKYEVEIHRHPETGQRLREVWRLDGQEHKEDGPAIRYWSANGTLTKEEYYIHGQRHRENGPQELEYDAATGELLSETWCQNDKQHREGNLPSMRDWHRQTKKLWSELYRVKDELHRTDGPAIVHYDENTGEIENVEYYEHGIQFFPDAEIDLRPFDFQLTS